MSHTSIVNHNNGDGETSSSSSDTESVDNQSRKFTLYGSSRFQINKEITQTLQGRIVMATDITNYQQVVIKEAWKVLIDRGISRSGLNIAEDFLYERDLLLYLTKNNNDGIIKVIDHWESDECYFYAMEWCPIDLFDYVSAHFRMNNALYHKLLQKTQRTMKIANEWVYNMTNVMYQLCQTVQWLHQKRYCHLDISLENIMFHDVHKLKIKLIDFGLTQPFNKEDNAYFQGRNGKREYVSPEIWDNKTYDGTKADVWSLGVVLYAVLVGALPYKVPDTKKDAMFYAVIDGDIKGSLIEQKRLCLITDDALDLVQRMLRYEKERISLNDVLQHPFFNAVNGVRRGRKRERWSGCCGEYRDHNVSRSRTR